MLVVLRWWWLLDRSLEVNFGGDRPTLGWVGAPGSLCGMGERLRAKAPRFGARGGDACGCCVPLPMPGLRVKIHDCSLVSTTGTRCAVTLLSVLSWSLGPSSRAKSSSAGKFGPFPEGSSTLA